MKAKDVEIEFDGEGFADVVRRVLEAYLASHAEAGQRATTSPGGQITEEKWRGFLAGRTDLQLDLINKLRTQGGEITLRELSSVTKGDTRKLGGLVGSLNRLTRRDWGIWMIEQKQRVQHPDGKTEYGYSFNSLVPWQVE